MNRIAINDKVCAAGTALRSLQAGYSHILVDEQLKHAAPKVTLGIVYANVHVTKHKPGLWAELNECMSDIRSSLKLDSLASDDHFANPRTDDGDHRIQRSGRPGQPYTSRRRAVESARTS